MIAVIIIGAVVLGAIMIYAWVKIINAIFRPLEGKNNNPYINSHLQRRKNDANYERYLDWLNRTGGGLPIDKVKFEEEIKFERKLNQEL